VFRSHKLKIANFRTDYAKPADFCNVFVKDTKPLYLLAFLLTANHKESEQCFVSTVEEAFKEQAVFKEWARSWVRRRMIENAIEIVSPAALRSGQKRDLWSAGQRTHSECEIDTVTKLAPFERFIFVMSILERLSGWDCSLLLGCTIKSVAVAQIRGLRRLPEFAALSSRGQGQLLRRREVTSEKAFPLAGSGIVYRC
jgi:hypothetical protein